MLANVALRDAKPAVVVCPDCKQRLMEIKDVQWATTKLEFTYECSGCGAELKKAIEGTAEIATFTSRASDVLRNLQIFTFSPDQIGRGNSEIAGETPSHFHDDEPTTQTHEMRRLT